MQVDVFLNRSTLARVLSTSLIPFPTLVAPEVHEQSNYGGGESVDGHCEEYTVPARLKPFLVEVRLVFVEQELIQKGTHESALLLEVCINYQRQNSQVDELSDESPPSQHLLLR
jgi:hypothetical protein